MYTKRFLMAAACSLLVSAAIAQDNEKGTLKSYTYVEAQGGAQLTFTNAKMDKLVTPTVALSLGHYFSPVVGARLHVNGWQAKSGWSATEQYYKWNYITTNADLMLNLTNMFCKDNSHFLNVILLGGIGLTEAWDNDELKALHAADRQLDVPLAWDKNRLSHNIRAGLRLETNVTKPFGISLEINANSLSDRFNSKTNDKDDWMVTGMLGISYRFGHRYKAAPVPVVEPTPAPVPEPAPVPVVVPKTKTITKKIPVNLREEVFYKIREADAEASKMQMQRVANFLKENPTATVSVTGYADKGTGNATLNMKFSKQRAENYKKQLVDNYGADASRINIDAKGDTVQPFAENDKNRCVIVEGAAEKTVTETVTVNE